MADNVTYAFQRFDLNSEEQDGVDLSINNIQQSVEKCQLSLVGKVIGEKVANFTGIKNFTTHIQGYSRNLRVTELKANLLQFHLEAEQERDKTFYGGPWVMDNQLLVIKQQEEDIEMKMEVFNITFLWVQIQNMPIHRMNKPVGFKISKIFGSVREVIIPTREKIRRHVNIFAEIDISKPLARGTRVKMNGVQQ